MDSRQLCMALLAAESEAAVQAIIEKTPEMRDSSNWHPLDGRDTNFNVVTNQAMTGGKAATELMTNMVDAMLMKAAYKAGIDPKGDGSEVPQTMYEAVDKLILNLYGGKLVNASEDWLRNYSKENLIIGITGGQGTKKDPGQPCMTFTDNGEGQHPDNFERSFLSLSTGHKKDIPFVQGKFNMGSSGVLSYCGEKWFKLIVSRCYDKTGDWGWTLIRRRPDSESGGIADYFAVGHSIPSFELDCLYPFMKDGQRFGDFHLSSGTVIKLYDYFLGSGYTGFRGTREALNENLVETILPFRLYDFRYKPDLNKGGLRALGIDPRPFYGMEYLLLRSHVAETGDDEEQAFSEQEDKLTVTPVLKDPDLGAIEITAILLKKELPSWLKPNRSNNRVFHTVNGQVQYKQTRGFLSQCKYQALMDRVIIIVDASKLTNKAHGDIWKGDREHLRDTPMGSHYKAVVKEALLASDVLDDLKQRIAREELTQTTKKEGSDVFQKLVKNDRNLAHLLDDTDPSIVIPVPTPKPSEYVGKYSPTFLEHESKSPEQPIEIPINKGRPIVARTDVVNDYFTRADNRGYLYISDDEVDKYFRIRTNLKDGRLTVFITPARTANLPVGMQFAFDIGLHDPAMPEPKTFPVTIVIAEESEKPPPPPSPTPPPPTPDDQPKKGLPRYKLLIKPGYDEIPGEDCEAWPDDFDDYDGGIVTDLGDAGIVYKINYHNAYHLKARQAKKGDVEKDALTQKYILGMRILMLGFEHALRRQSEANQHVEHRDGGDSDFEDHKAMFRRMAAKGAATTVLSVADALPRIIAMPDDEPE